MAHKDFDASKLVKVDINKVFPNDYNPKEEDTREYRKIKQSIKQKGLRGAVVVRNFPNTPGSYMIIDGQQRYTAAKELGYKEIYIYNEGDVPEQEAKEMTIWYQQQVPFNRITEAYLVTSMVEEFGMENIEVPYSSAEIKEFQDLAEFNFDSYKNDGEMTRENPDGTITFSMKMTKQQHDIVTTKLKEYSAEYECNSAEALAEIMEGIVVNG